MCASRAVLKHGNSSLWGCLQHGRAECDRFKCVARTIHALHLSSCDKAPGRVICPGEAPGSLRMRLKLFAVPVSKGKRFGGWVQGALETSGGIST